jgi:putative membrane protein
MLAITDYLAGVPLFLGYFAIALVLTAIYVVIYTMITPHSEMKLIKENKAAASTAFAGSLIGFVLPLASVIENSVDIADMALWGAVALIVQIATFFGLRLFMPKISERIANDEMASGIWLGAVSVAAGLLNAACLTY